ncbi:MAG: hypothetical protein ACW97P_10570, partial [Candidatus Hodarchaeales archaeon]
MNFKDMIEGKNVLLLGPASYLRDKKIDLSLDDYDVVVKINKMVEKNVLQSSLCNRNEILYHCLDINIPNGDLPYDTELWLNRGVKHLRITHPPITAYFRNNINRFNNIPQDKRPKHSIVDSETFVWIKRGCKTLPNAGTIAIFDLLANNPSKLTIRGVTFCKTPYCDGYKEDVFYKKKTK